MTQKHPKKAPVLHLRPHHLLCIQNYRGHGYSTCFHEKMTSVITSLQTSAGAPIELTDSADDLCIACPHCRDGVCESENPARFDKIVSDLTGAVPGHTFIWKFPAESADRLACGCDESCDHFRLPVMSMELLEKCCRGCSWLELCMEIVSG